MSVQLTELVRKHTSSPRLEQGDRLTRDEFERRYQAMPSARKAELIEGIVYMPAAVRWKHHSSPHALIMYWLTDYCIRTPGTDIGDNATIRLDLDNEPQPDSVLIIDPACGGRVQISDDDYIEGAPELVVEVAASSVSIDMHQKKNVYRRNQVHEYIVWRVQDNEIDWFILRGGEYFNLEPNDDGSLRSEVFPGLWLDATAMIGGDMGKVVQLAQRGTDSEEHATFIQSLATRS